MIDSSPLLIKPPKASSRHKVEDIAWSVWGIIKKCNLKHCCIFHFLMARLSVLFSSSIAVFSRGIFTVILCVLFGSLLFFFHPWERSIFTATTSLTIIPIAKLSSISAPYLSFWGPPTRVALGDPSVGGNGDLWEFVVPPIFIPCDSSIDNTVIIHLLCLTLGFKLRFVAWVFCLFLLRPSSGGFNRARSPSGRFVFFSGAIHHLFSWDGVQMVN